MQGQEAGMGLQRPSRAGAGRVRGGWDPTVQQAGLRPWKPLEEPGVGGGCDSKVGLGAYESPFLI